MIVILLLFPSWLCLDSKTRQCKILGSVWWDICSKFIKGMVKEHNLTRQDIIDKHMVVDIQYDGSDIHFYFVQVLFEIVHEKAIPYTGESSSE